MNDEKILSVLQEIRDNQNKSLEISETRRQETLDLMRNHTKKSRIILYTALIILMITIGLLIFGK